MAQTRIPQYAVHDFSLKSAVECANPFSVSLTATFRHESGETLADVPGFYDGNGEWKVRFCPSREGTWAGRTASEVPELDGLDLGEIGCTPRTNPALHGVLRVDPEHRQRLAWEDGSPFLALGFECDWLFSYHQADGARCCRHVDMIAERGFNYIVANLYAHTGFTLRENDDTRPYDPADVYAPPKGFLFEGNNEEPDHARPSVAFYRDFDALMRHLHSRGIVMHLMVQVQNKRVNWPERGTPEDEGFWQYVVARYQAFGNLVWDVSKEAKNLKRETGSHAYTIERMERIRAADAYGHLVTAHDTVPSSFGTFCEADAAADIFTDQIHLADVGRYNREAIRCLRILQKPYLNVEYGYELGVEDLKTYRNVKTTAGWEDMLKWTWALYAAGAYPCYYYNNTSWDLIRFEPESPGWVRYRYLRDFLEELPFNRMRADNDLVDSGYCLAETGKAYLVYLPEGGDAVIDLSAAEGSGEAACEWMDILTGTRVGAGVDSTKFITHIQNPLDDTAQAAVVAVRVKG